MSIKFACACGRSVRAPDEAAGRKAKCPNCGAVLTIPAAAGGEGDELELKPVEMVPVVQKVTPGVRKVAEPVAEAPNPYAGVALGRQGGTGAWRRFMYLVLLLGLIPLIVHTVHEAGISREDRKEDIQTRLEETVKAHPELPDLAKQINAVIDREESTLDDLYAVLPGHKLAGALLARDTEEHWVFAGMAAGGSMVFLLLMFPGARKRAVWLFLAGLFTGTIGILLLLGFQYAATFSGNVGFRFGGGKLGLILLLVQLIGLSYKLTDMDVGFVLSFIGFTCGVGLCEEVTKAIPLLFKVKEVPGQEDFKWNDLLLIGLASGFGFGIAESIMYSHRYYNGMEGSSIYWVRFVSCVVLHATWAGAVGVTLYNRQEWLKTDNWWGYWGRVVMIVGVPMVLHGLYDTLLKMDYNGWALGVAVASFGWLAWQIERMQRAEPAVG